MRVLCLTVFVCFRTAVLEAVPTTSRRLTTTFTAGERLLQALGARFRDMISTSEFNESSALIAPDAWSLLPGCVSKCQGPTELPHMRREAVCAMPLCAHEPVCHALTALRPRLRLSTRSLATFSACPSSPALGPRPLAKQRVD